MVVYDNVIAVIMVNIYILELEGETTVEKPTIRSNSSTTLARPWCKWTQKHKPVDLYAFHEMEDSDENKFTLAMMRNFGVESVRGGYGPGKHVTK